MVGGGRFRRGDAGAQRGVAAPFVMYYRTFPLGGVRADLRAAGFTVETVPLEHFGRTPQGAPRWRLVLARRRPSDTARA